jgi:ADP-heptose:LPS heptosyltransferase
MNLKTKQFIDSFIGMPAAVLHLVAARLLGLVMRRNHGTDIPPKNILIIKILGLGSVFLASDALLALKKKYPEAKLILVCNRSLKAGLDGLGLFDEIWAIDDRSFWNMLKTSLSILTKSWSLKRLWVADLEVYSKLTTLFSLWTFAINRFGFYLNEVSFRDKLNTHHVYFNQFCIVEENYKRMAEMMGAETKQKFYFPDFPPRISAREKKYNYIAINNTCSELGQERKMPDRLMSELCYWIVQNTDYKIALLGAPSDRLEVEGFRKKYLNNIEPSRVLDTIGQFSFDQYYRFLYDDCALVLTIDSAPLHIARKLGVPTISVWGPTVPETRITIDDQNRVVYLGVTCSPCVHFTDILPCGGDNFCMKDITLNQITQLIPIQ